MEVLLERADFISFLVEAGALQFGSFTLKSGRVSPYFFNSAQFRSGPTLARLGEFFAGVIAQVAPQATIVFGPAYKGIPLCVAASMALSRQTGRELGYLFNRKEAKTHGDTGLFVGQTPQAGDRLVLVDDVITDGQTKYEAVALLRDAFPGVPIDALVIAFNRMERDAQGRDALAEFQRATGIPVHAIVSLADLRDALAPAGALAGMDLPGAHLPGDLLQAVEAYQQAYGVPGV